jgi:hypothetical protein
MPDRLTPKTRQRQLSMHSRRALARSPSSQGGVDPKETLQRRDQDPSIHLAPAHQAIARPYQPVNRSCDGTFGPGFAGEANR